MFVKHPMQWFVHILLINPAMQMVQLKTPRPSPSCGRCNRGTNDLVYKFLCICIIFCVLTPISEAATTRILVVYIFRFYPIIRKTKSIRVDPYNQEREPFSRCHLTTYDHDGPPSRSRTLEYANVKRSSIDKLLLFFASPTTSSSKMHECTFFISNCIPTATPQ